MVPDKTAKTYLEECLHGLLPHAGLCPLLGGQVVVCLGVGGGLGGWLGAGIGLELLTSCFNVLMYLNKSSIQTPDATVVCAHLEEAGLRYLVERGKALLLAALALGHGQRLGHLLRYADVVVDAELERLGVVLAGGVHLHGPEGGGTLLALHCTAGLLNHVSR